MSHRQAIGLGRTFAAMERLDLPLHCITKAPATNPKECADHVYLEFHSRELECPVRVGVEYLEAVNYQHCSMPDAVELRDVWIGGVDLSMHLSDTCMKALQRECDVAWDARGDWS